VINGLQTILPRFRSHGEGGHIVNTASLAALVSMPAQYGIYMVAKAAVVTLSETIRSELMKDGIGVTVLCPGPVARTFTRRRITARNASRPELPSRQPSVPQRRYPSRACWNRSR
jgi:short-subunit dehydrogenase